MRRRRPWFAAASAGQQRGDNHSVHERSIDEGLPRCRFCDQPVKAWAWRCGHCGSGFATPYQWGPRLAIIVVLGGLYLWSIVKYFGY